MGNRKLKKANWKWGVKNDKLLIVNCKSELKIFCSRGLEIYVIYRLGGPYGEKL